MELKDSPAEAEFRAQARAWLQDTMPQLGGAEPARLEDKLDYWRTWQGCSSMPDMPGCRGPSNTVAAARTPNCARSSTRNSTGPALLSGSTSSARISPGPR